MAVLSDNGVASQHPGVLFVCFKRDYSENSSMCIVLCVGKGLYFYVASHNTVVGCRCGEWDGRSRIKVVMQ